MEGTQEYLFDSRMRQVKMYGEVALIYWRSRIAQTPGTSRSRGPWRGESNLQEDFNVKVPHNHRLRPKSTVYLSRLWCITIYSTISCSIAHILSPFIPRRAPIISVAQSEERS